MTPFRLRSALSLLLAGLLLPACSAPDAADRPDDEGYWDGPDAASLALADRGTEMAAERRAAGGPGAVGDAVGAGERAVGAPTASAEADTAPSALLRRQQAAGVDGSRITAIVLAAERVAPAVVTVNVLRTSRVQPRTAWENFFLPPGATRPTSGLGSGFVIDASGIILTNDHVVRDADRIMVTFPDGRDLEAELVGRDEVTDVAVLRVRGGDLPTVPLGTSEGILIGEWAVAIGNPFGNLLSNAEPSVSAGVVSAVGRHIVPSAQERGFYLGMIQTDASVNPGNSGGPLVNALGEVIGVNSSIFSRSGGSEGLSFAIPIDRALRIADDLVRHGQVRRAWTGLEVEAVEADAWGRTRGVRTGRVAEDSPAARAGIRDGSNLLEANGRRLSTPLDFEAVLLDLRAGDPLDVVVEGRNAPVTLRTEELPSLRAQRVTVFRDLQLITLTPAIRSERGIANEAGAVIAGISNSLSATLGLREGDVLLQVNNTRIRTAEEAAEAFERVPDRGGIRIYFERNGSTGVRDFYVRR
ncbi:MAG: trypsin-like peptidase domain-containing protein [Gemmatimonadota bacterium]